MAGLEKLEIHSKSYIVRWIRAEDGHSISWSIQPHKKSINFGIIKHPGNLGTDFNINLSVEDTSSTSLLEPDIDKSSRSSSTRNDTSTAQEKLKAKGFIIVQWYGKCEADKVFMGTHAVVGYEGMYGLVLDNTFSKQLLKTATLVLLTFPTNAPPKSYHHHLNSVVSLSNPKKPSMYRQNNTSTPISCYKDNFQNNNSSMTTARTSCNGSLVDTRESAEIPKNHVGVLSKRRRKKGQGYARRFFSLDFATCTLSYYYNRNSSALRGAIPLSLAAVTADRRKKEISIDAGAEIWHLKTDDGKDFEQWTKALQRASKIALGKDLVSANFQKSSYQSELKQVSSFPKQEEEQVWEHIEALVSRIVGTRDAVERLFKKTAPSEIRANEATARGPSTFKNSMSGEETDYFNHAIVPEKKTFWKRKCSSNSSSQVAGRPHLGKSTSSMVSAISIGANSSSVSPAENGLKDLSNQDINMHEHCSALLCDLNAVLSDFSELIARSKRCKTISKAPGSNCSDSNSTFSNTEFFDAESGHLDCSQAYGFNSASEDDLQTSDQDGAEDELISEASSLSSPSYDESPPHLNAVDTIFPSRSKNLEPLPIKLFIPRRELIPPVTVMPPSLIGFLRKNVGKDLSTISMPVSANEPTSLLQRIAEQFEYAQLLDKAVSQTNPDHRLCYVSAFAISNFSINRCKERALRKPFNPMLGETFELLRTEHEVPSGFRFLAEKVSHRPVRIACQADSVYWSINQTAVPTNKFWGKSAEIITEGRVRLALHLSDGRDELYSWSVASCFLRNVVLGEKYIEPVGTTTVVNESTGANAFIEFKHKGMFGGRSEDVEVKINGSDGKSTGISLIGTWTNSLRIVGPGKSSDSEIWHVGELVEGATKRYGLTKFAASLNEITKIEKGKIPITDCRLRSDQRAVENGSLDEAEKIKETLEENQRIRRKEMEENGGQWKPRWFIPVDGGEEGEEIWKLKMGKEGYWEERSQGTWTGVSNVLSL
ncbi:Oxysterol-binding [Erysiphe necator]|nr:Oxysterol-binding [Erysiphe necator]